MASMGLLVRRALDDADIVAPLQRAAAVDVIAAGKAAAVMLNALAFRRRPCRRDACSALVRILRSRCRKPPNGTTAVTRS